VLCDTYSSGASLEGSSEHSLQGLPRPIGRMDQLTTEFSTLMKPSACRQSDQAETSETDQVQQGSNNADKLRSC